MSEQNLLFVQDPKIFTAYEYNDPMLKKKGWSKGGYFLSNVNAVDLREK